MAYQFDVLAPRDRVFLGEDKRIEAVIYDQGTMSDEELEAAITAGTAPPVNVSGWSLTWALRLKDNSADPALIQKSTGGSGITVEGTFNSNPALNTQLVVIQLEDSDSYNPPTVELKAARYRHSLKRMDAGIETVLFFGYFQFVQATVR